METEVMSFDVVIVGAGPAGLSAAIRLKQQTPQLSVAVLEKGASVGAHLVSGAVFETRALDELFPNWQEMDAPIRTQVTQDEMHLLRNDKQSIEIPHLLVPKPLHNKGNYIISLGRLCQWLEQQALQLEVDIFAGFSAQHLLYESNRVIGVRTGSFGIDKQGNEKGNFTPALDIHAQQVILAEGCRGHLGKELIERFDLAADVEPQHYGIGLKEIWKVPPEQCQPGKVIHTAHWPLNTHANGGGFLYHLDDRHVALGLVVDLDYSNPYLDPFKEMQRMKHHPLFAAVLKGGERISFGARAIAKGGLHSLPTMQAPGAFIIGCDAGTLNPAKIKGIHCAMKSAMLVADTITSNWQAADEKVKFAELFKASWLYEELYRARNFSKALKQFGIVKGGAYNWFDHAFFGGKLPFNLGSPKADHCQLHGAHTSTFIDYQKPDGVLSFDRPSSVFIANTHHEENQPVHLIVDEQVIAKRIAKYAEPAQRYCPAGVYELIELDGQNQLQINAANCLHCKTCDIKDPYQKITWSPPEAGGGPNYLNM